MNIIKYRYDGIENFQDFSMEEKVEIMFIMLFFDRIMTKSREFTKHLEGSEEIHCYDVEKKDLKIVQRVIIPFEKDPCRFVEMSYDGRKVFEANSRQNIFTIFTFSNIDDDKAWRSFIHWVYSSSPESIAEFEINSSVHRF